MLSRGKKPSNVESEDQDSELQSLSTLIKKSHKNPNDDSLQQEALEQSMNYIHKHAEQRHLFCDKGMYQPSIHALILFSFPENEALTWYKDKVARRLNECSKCITLFHRGRAKLKTTFAIERGIDASSVQQFIGIILKWEAQRLFERVAPIFESFQTKRGSGVDVPVPREVLMGVAECLCAPGMLRANEGLKKLFGKMFYYLLSTDHKLVTTTKSLTPGTIYLLFEGDDVQKKWAFKALYELYDPSQTLKFSTVSSDILEEYEVHFLNIQSPAHLNETTCETFYRVIYPLLRLYDINVILNKFSLPQDIESIQKVLNYDVLPLLKLVQVHIMKYFDQSLPYILRFFTLIVSQIGEKFWNHTSNYTFHNFIETISGSPNFVKNLERLKIATPSPERESIANLDATLDDLISWIEPFNATLVASKKQQSQNKIALCLIVNMESQNEIPLDNRAVIFEKACLLVNDALTFSNKLYSPGFSTELLLKSDSRVIVDEKMIRFIDYATCKAIFFPPSDKVKNGEIAKNSIQVLCRALEFDLISFAQNSYEIHNGRRPATLKFSPELFKNLLNQRFSVQLELAFQLLSSMVNVSGIIPLEGPHKADVQNLLNYLAQFFTNFSDIDVKNIKMILSNAKSLSGYWSCVFSSDSTLYQSAVDILYETFDASGRLEGVHGLLSNNLDACIKAINNNLTNLIFIKFYEPCPRAVKVLTDVIHALNNRINGLFAGIDHFTESTKESLTMFWNRCWNFLDLIYVETLSWANQYTDEDLIEFTRDTLDLSFAVLQCFRTINKITGDDDSKKTFSEITNTFPHMLVWLRLSDPGLLASCVQVISLTIDLAVELNIKLDSNVIILLAKYASRAKKFNNKLTSQQSSEIIDRAKLLDKELVEITVNESERAKRAKESREDSISPAPQARYSTSVSPPTDTKPPSSFSNTASVPPRKGQLKITNFGSLSKTPQTAPSKAQLPLSALEKARREMRAVEKAPPRVIHKPRPLGFNQRERSERAKKDESSDDESESEDAHSLFNLPKAKKEPGITLLGEPKSLIKSKRTAAEERKKEEENSRLRLNVNMKPLYNKILQWNYQDDSDSPDGVSKYPKVPEKFASADDYIKTYEPLLLLECWQAIINAKRRETEKPIAIEIASKTTVDNFFEVFFNFSKSSLSEKGITESDLVVLGLYERNTSEPNIQDMKRSKVTCLAKVNEIKFVKGDSVDVSLRVMRSSTLNNVLTPNSPIILMKVMQMTTIEREYSSLHGLRYYNLSKEILQGLPDAGPSLPLEEINEVKTNYNVNESQAKAIASSTKSSGFFLIQGPPGTGKTKTILGIIGHMLSSFRASNAIALPTGPTSNQAQNIDLSKAKKVLVCAPSNAAVDELVLRLKDGIVNSKGVKYSPKLVRLGRTDAVNSAVKDMTLEELVDSQLGKNNTNNGDQISALFQELSKVKISRDKCKADIADNKEKDLTESRKLLKELNQKSNNIKKKLDEERERQSSAHRSREINRRNIQAKILGEAEIICSTLSGAAHDMVANIGIKFDSVIIDEACQCTELSAIIPLRYGCKRCIMVGDPNQLPPTVLSSVAADSKYDQSLFVRMANHVKPLLLDVQYRMHSDISRFPSKKFYDGMLKDGPNMDSLTKRPWHENTNFPPYKFFDIVEGQGTQNSKTFSYTNRMEIEIAMEMIGNLFRTFPKIDFTNKIGVITPYKEQNISLQREFVRRFGNSIKREITFNTIDGFQGQEKEIIIISCVRADKTGGVGFLRDYRRMNVAMTRSKCSLWILGNHESLVKNELWEDLIKDAREREKFITARRGFTETQSGRIREIPASGMKKKESSEDKSPTSVVPKSELGASSTTGLVPRPDTTKAGNALSEERNITDVPQVQKNLANDPNLKKPMGKKSAVFKPSSTRVMNNKPISSTNSPVPNSTNPTNVTNNRAPNNATNALPLPTSTNNFLPKVPTGPRAQGTKHKRPQDSIFLNNRKRRR